MAKKNQPAQSGLNEILLYTTPILSAMNSRCLLVQAKRKRLRLSCKAAQDKPFL